MERGASYGVPESGKKGAGKVWLKLYNQHMPSFTDVFDEETFYWTALAVVISTILVAYFLSRRITLRPVDW